MLEMYKNYKYVSCNNVRERQRETNVKLLKSRWRIFLQREFMIQIVVIQNILKYLKIHEILKMKMQEISITCLYTTNKIKYKFVKIK